MATKQDGNDLISNIPLIISTLVVVLTVVGGFWSLADPRAELRNIRENYLTIREHSEFANKVTRDITRIEQRDDDLIKGKADKEDLTALSNAVDQRISQVTASRVRELDQIEKQIDALNKQIAALSDRINIHIERDSDRFSSKPANGK